MKKINVLSAFIFLLGFPFLYCLSGQSQLKAVHEWGTFTTVQNSAGQRLPGLIGENLPKFVYDMKLTSNSNIELKNVEVQMETPVLYFYADKQMDVAVDVNFKNGIINQWYPDRSSGQTTNVSVIDFSTPSQGFNKWEITILDTQARNKLKNVSLYSNSINMELEYEAPRSTNSNYIKAIGKDEYEKFIFYRGLANFETPVRAEFNQQNNLVIQNQLNESLSYVMVFDNSPNRQPTIWWSGSMKAGEKKVIANPIIDSKYEDVNNEINNFFEQLVTAGLFPEEAGAMLNTWYGGYFINSADVEGLRVFWITPKAYIDEMLPLTITPTPLSTQRVFVGRSEVLKKEFENELNGLTLNEIDSIYTYHHYLNVFKEAKKKGFPTQWTDYNDNVVTAVIDKSKNPLTLRLMPNPITESFIMQYRSDELADIQVSIVDLSGHIIHQWKETPSDLICKKNYSLKDLQKGSYILQTAQKGKLNAVKFIKQ